MNDQIPAGTSPSTLRSNTKHTWNSQVLNKVRTTDRDSFKIKLLYTSLYGMNLLPQNKTGENPMWESAEPYYDDIFTLWDLVSNTSSARFGSY